LTSSRKEKPPDSADGSLSWIAHSDRSYFELGLDDLLLLFRFLLVGSDQFGVGGQRLQKNAEPSPFVGERHAEVQPKSSFPSRFTTVYAR
jgi:hypothetical protein